MLRVAEIAALATGEAVDALLKVLITRYMILLISLPVSRVGILLV
jgi:hypothetical protein